MDYITFIDQIPINQDRHKALSYLLIKEEVADLLHFPSDILMSPVIFWASSWVTF